MNDDLFSEIDSLLTPDNIQPKADILESNLFKDLKHSNDNTYAEIKFSRKNTINGVIDKALQQLLFRFNIYPPSFGANLRKALKEDLSDNIEGITLSFEIDENAQVSAKRSLVVCVKQNEIIIQISGVPKIPEKNEEITRFYFDYKDYPGKLLPNGKFDFRELHKFPSVQERDKLLFVRYASAGVPGLTFDGKLIPVSEPLSLNLETKEGVIKKVVYNKNGSPVGYFVIAAKTGVVIMNKSEEQIKQIDVSDTIQLETIDFSIGNIGSEFISPVSMKIGTIIDGFKIRANGVVEVASLDGGEVITESDALIDQVRPHSTITAKENIVARTVVDSSLNCHKGTITIQTELRDSIINAPHIIFKTSKGLIINNSIETCNFESQNLYFCGNNKIYLGKDLFNQRNAIKRDVDKLDKSIADINKAIDTIKSQLLTSLKDLAVQIQEENVLNMFKLLIQTLKESTFSDSFKVLENLRSHLNVMQIDSVKKSFKNIEKLSKAQTDIQNKKAVFINQLTQVEQSINRIKFTINGQINPTATIQIYCDKKNMEDPSHEIKPYNRESNEAISVSGRYNLKDGLITG